MSFPPHIIASLGMPEVVVIFVVALLLFGGKNMPHLARTLGRVVREFKKASSEIERELKSVIDDDPQPRKKSLPQPKESDPTEQEESYDESIYPELEENYDDLNQAPDVSALPPPVNETENSEAVISQNESPEDTPAPEAAENPNTPPTENDNPDQKAPQQ